MTMTRYLLAFELVDREDRGDFFARRKREQVDQCRAARLTRRVGNFVAAQAVDAPLVREEEHVVVRLGHEEVSHDVFALEIRDAGTPRPPRLCVRNVSTDTRLM